MVDLNLKPNFYVLNGFRWRLIDYNIEDGVVEVNFSNIYIFCQIGIDTIRSHTDKQ